MCTRLSCVQTDALYVSDSCTICLSQFIDTWHLFVTLTSPSDKGFGLDTYKKATMVGRSLCAQYEDVCAKYAPQFLNNMSVSYIKILLVADMIWKWGWNDELSIDTRMKSFWSAVGVVGGAGCNAEEWAVKGYLRSLALLKFRMTMEDSARANKLFLQSPICPKFHLDREINGATKEKYMAILRYMYGGNIGLAIARAFSTCGTWDEDVVASVRSVELPKLRYLEALRLAAGDPSKMFRTYFADARAARQTGGRPGRVPHVGSNFFVTGAAGHDPMLIRMQVEKFA